MRKPIAVAALFLTALVPSPASAQIFVGLRTAWAVPFGDLETGAPAKDAVNWQIPISLDLGLRLGKALEIGAYAAYGFVQPSARWRTDCDARGSDCSAAQLRFGAQLNLHAVQSERTELWGGVAVGYEELHLMDSLGLAPELTWKGFDATLQGGLDLLVSARLRVGPFVGLTVGQFNKVEAASEEDVSSKAFHGWLQIGLRGLFGT